jgi:HAD superfamily phosphoserine phosphatase-like hydrolase
MVEKRIRAASDPVAPFATGTYPSMTTSVCLLDWDGTLRREYVIHDWTKYLAREGKVAKRFVKLMETGFAQHKAKRINYNQMAERVVETFAMSQKELRASDLHAHAKAFADADLKIFRFAAPLIAELHKKGIEPIVITGSPTSVVKYLAEKIGISHCYGLELDIDDAGVFLGTYRQILAVEKYKRALVKQLQLECRDVRLAIGNSPSDIPLLEVARCAYYITDNPAAARKNRRLSALWRAEILQFVSPEELLHLVKTDNVFWR